MRRILVLFNPELPPRMWLLQAGVLINFLGNGMVAPFLVIYLHFGRGIPLGLAGSAVALGGVTAVTSGLAAGALVDRFGPRNILVLAMCCNAAAYLLYTQVSVPWQAFAVGLLVGAGTGAYGPSSQTLIASMVPPERRQAAFAQNRVTAVVGLALGGSIGGLIASAGLEGYLRLLVLDMATFLVFAALSLLLPAGRATTRESSGGGYAAVLRDRGFVRLVGVNVGLVAFSIAPMLVLLPAFAKGQSHVGEAAIGAIYAANALTVVALQLPLARWSRGRNRMRLLRQGALTWIGSWTVALLAGAGLSGSAAAVAFGLAAITYAVGECLYSAILVPTAAAMAPDHLRGRYLGAVGLAWQSGFLIGPAVGGAVLGAFPLGLPLLCIAGCVAAALVTGAVDRELAPDQRRNPVVAAA